LTDQQLAQKISESNEKAFKKAFHKFYQRMYRFMLVRTQSEENSKDLVQDVFIRLWQSRRSINPKLSLPGYLFCIANNIYIDFCRKEQNQPEPSAQLDELFYDDGPAENVELKLRLYAAIKKLPQDLGTVFILQKIEGLRQAEIAEICEISTRTVEGRLSRAIKILKTELE